MDPIFNFLLFIITLIGGSIPFFIPNMDERRTNNLLAFSGSFLLGITLLHLLPEAFAEVGKKAGILLLAGFFIQLIIQRYTHGVEHGHIHLPEEKAGHTHHHAISLSAILIGLSVHAFMEGLPLGYNYRLDATGPSLYFAVAAHKLPEAMLLTTLVTAVKGKARAINTILYFALITPVASMLAVFLGQHYYAVSEVIGWMIPVVAGAFIHISTTIFFESGTRQHALTRPKLIAILIGVGMAALTLLME